MTAQLTLGVIGHVDHGKTALVKALSGIDTDRLKEEKERGLSIVLGFSYLRVPAGNIDLIDVPGHEDFIRTMISGATGIDGVLLIIAANEGVMPQTREHFQIAELLGVERGIVVISKIDLVPEDERDAVVETVRTYTAGTFLSEAPVVCASAVSSEGLDALQTELTQLLRDPVQRPGGRRFYLPVDRVFSMSGFGTVATGTLRGGTLGNDADVEILPVGGKAAIRQLQRHNEIVDCVYPGQRVAINLRHTKKEQISRGDILAPPGYLTATRRLDAELRLLGELAQPLKNGELVRLLFGTSEIMAIVKLLDKKTLAPGSTGFVQFRCRRDVATQQDEHFIIRSYSPVRTIGGGQILDPRPTRHRRFDESIAERLHTTAHGSAQELISERVSGAGLNGVTINALTEAVDLDGDAVRAMLDDGGCMVINESLIIDRVPYQKLVDSIATALEQHHADNPTERSVGVRRLQSSLPTNVDNPIFDYAIAELVAAGRVESEQGTLRIAGFDPLANLNQEERNTAADIEDAFLRGGMMPPKLEEVVGRDKAKQDMYRLLSEHGQLVVLRNQDRKNSLVFHSATLSEIRQRLHTQYPHPSEFTVSEVRTLLDSTRKFVVPLLEHFDTTGVTIRKGDVRQLRIIRANE